MTKQTKKRKTRHPGITRQEDGSLRIRVKRKDPRTGRVLDRMLTLAKGARLDQAVRRKAELVADILDEIERGPKAQMPTLADWTEQWYSIRSIRVKTTTAIAYKHHLAHRILPRLGHMYLDEINRSDLESWVGWAERTTKTSGASYSQASVQNWWNLLKIVLRDGFVEHDLPDATRRIRGPKRQGGKHRVTRVMSASELGEFLAAFEGSHPYYCPAVATLAWTGARVGEVCALHWEDVHLGERAVALNWTVFRGKRHPAKTGDGRTVAIPQRLADMLQRHREEMIARQAPGLSKGIVFPSRAGDYLSSMYLWRLVTTASREIGWDWEVTPNVFRRTYNTLLVRAGVDRLVIRSMMGHCDEAMTSRYAGIDLTDKLEASLTLESLVGESVGSSVDRVASTAKHPRHDEVEVGAQ